MQEELIQGRKAMRNQYILLSTVCCGLFFGTEAWAQCVATKDCSTLGYKQSSCDSGKGIKCPFGEAWYCPCDASYIYTCTGTNESPSSAKCGDKYSMCNCATGTHWDSSSGRKPCFMRNRLDLLQRRHLFSAGRLYNQQNGFGYCGLCQR